MGVVGAPDEVVLSDEVRHLPHRGLLLEGGGALAEPVVAGLHAQWRVKLLVQQSLREDVVHSAQDERDPGASELAQDEPEVWVLLACAAEDDGGQPLSPANHADGEGCPLVGQLVLGEVLAVGEGRECTLRRRVHGDAAAAEVEGDAHAGLGDGPPERVPVAVTGVDGMRAVVDDELTAPQGAQAGRLVQLFGCDGGVVQGDAGQGVEAPRMSIAEVGDPLVVDAEGGGLDLQVFDLQAGAGEAIQDFRLNAVHVLVPDAQIRRGGVRAAFVVAGLLHSVVAVAHAGLGRAEAHAHAAEDAQLLAFAHPDLAVEAVLGLLGGSVLHVGHEVPELGGGCAGEHVAGQPAHVHVGVARDEGVLHGRSPGANGLSVPSALGMVYGPRANPSQREAAVPAI